MFHYIISILSNAFKVVNKTLAALYRDICGIFLLFKVEGTLKHLEKNNIFLPNLFRKLVREHPNKACLIYNNETWTYQQVKKTHSLQLFKLFVL